MFFLLSKLLVFVFSPVCWLALLLGWAWATRHPTRRRWLLGTALLLTLVSTSPLLSAAALRAWEMPPTSLPSPSYHAGVLLTGLGDGRQRPLTLPANAWPTASRTAGALHLYRTGRIRRIIISGGSGNLVNQRPESEARYLARLLTEAGVPPAAIMLEERSRNTRENAVFTRQLLARRPDIQSLVLVTSAYHQRRALACFRRVGLQPAAFPTDFRAAALFSEERSWLLPSLGALRQWHLLLRELAGYCVYKVLGYC